MLAKRRRREERFAGDGREWVGDDPSPIWTSASCWRTVDPSAVLFAGSRLSGQIDCKGTIAWPRRRRGVPSESPMRRNANRQRQRAHGRLVEDAGVFPGARAFCGVCPFDGTDVSFTGSDSPGMLDCRDAQRCVSTVRGLEGFSNPFGSFQWIVGAVRRLSRTYLAGRTVRHHVSCVIPSRTLARSPNDVALILTRRTRTPNCVTMGITRLAALARDDMRWAWGDELSLIHI